jgi:hypothetical protein
MEPSNAHTSAAMAPTHTGVNVRRRDLLQALTWKRLDESVIKAVDTSEEGLALRTRKAAVESRDAKAVNSLAPFLDCLDDGALPSQRHTARMLSSQSGLCRGTGGVLICGI